MKSGLVIANLDYSSPKSHVLVCVHFANSER